MPEKNRKLESVAINEEEEHRRRWLQFALQNPQPFPLPPSNEKTADQEKLGETSRSI